MPATASELPLEARRPRHRRRGGSTLRPGLRGDIEGLRAVAVLLVMLYHAGVAQVPGGFVGVDVFFVVSGFVITAGLLRELESTGRVRLLDFYGRRAKRLLPAAGLVLLVTAVGSWLTVSRVQWQHIGGDIMGAALYVVNWVFAGRSVDYLAEDVTPSPVLHFWSLAVEEQFYLIWPVVMLGLFAYLRRAASRRAPDSGSVLPRRQDLAIGLILVIVGPSLLFSVVYSLTNPATAFFVTPTRLWELGAGGLVALAPRVFAAWQHRRGAWVAWAGVLLILSSAYLADRVPHWPGIAAMVPVAGTALVIAGGCSGSSMGPARILELRPLVWVGGLSYSLYLWHWPLLRFWEWQHGELTVGQGVAIVAFSFLPAWLSYRFVESPVRFARSLHTSPRYALSVGFNATLVALVSGLLLTQAAHVTSGDGAATGASWSEASGAPDSAPSSGPGAPAPADPGEVGSVSAVGGATIGLLPDDPSRHGARHEGAGDAADQATSAPPPGLRVPEAEQPGDEPFFDTLTPDPVAATGDVPALYAQGCQVDPEDTRSEPCVFGDPDGTIEVAVVGDSKIAQWMPALDAIARDQGWVIRNYTKSSCVFTAALTVVEGEPYHSCLAWGQDVLDRLTGAEKPVAVITSGGRPGALPTGAEEGEPVAEALVAGYVSYWSALEEEGIGVIAISDTQSPSGTGPVYECVEEHRDDPGVCSWSSTASPATTILQQAVSQVEQAHFIDMDPWVCPGQTCVGVYRNVLTYRQGSHLTATFAEVLTEPLAAHLVPVVDTIEAGR